MDDYLPATPQLTKLDANIIGTAIRAVNGGIKIPIDIDERFPHRCTLAHRQAHLPINLSVRV